MLFSGKKYIVLYILDPILIQKALVFTVFYWHRKKGAAVKYKENRLPTLSNSMFIGTMQRIRNHGQFQLKFVL